MAITQLPQLVRKSKQSVNSFKLPQFGVKINKIQERCYLQSLALLLRYIWKMESAWDSQGYKRNSSNAAIVSTLHSGSALHWGISEQFSWRLPLYTPTQYRRSGRSWFHTKFGTGTAPVKPPHRIQAHNWIIQEDLLRAKMMLKFLTIPVLLFSREETFKNICVIWICELHQ